jgi:hypothetical protein
MVSTGAIIAAVVCCVLVIIGTVLGVWGTNVACPDFGMDCQASTPPASRTPGPSGTPPTAITPPAAGTSRAANSAANSAAVAAATCPANQYKSGANGSCVSCPPGSYANQGSSSINDCYCGGNNIMNADKTGCNPCPAPPTGYVFRDPTGCATTIQFACYEAGPAGRDKPCCPGLSYNDGECY